MKKICLLFLLLPVFSLAQQKEKDTIRLRGIVSTGIVIGQVATQPFLQVSGGIRYDRYFTGLGIGFDGYQFYTIPVFADWRVGLGNKQIVYLYANGGYNFVASYREDIDAWKKSDRLKGGFYMDLGIGYRVPQGSHRLSFSAGYTRKDLVQKKEYLSNSCAACNDIFVFKYSLDRVIIKAGWEFGR